MFECKNYKLENKHDILCFKIEARSGYQERFVPISRHLKSIANITSTTGNLGNMFRRLPIWTNEIDKKLFFSLHLTFREKLKKLGLNSDLLNGLSGWNPRVSWTKQDIEISKDFIDRIEY